MKIEKLKPKNRIVWLATWKRKLKKLKCMKSCDAQTGKFFCEHFISIVNIQRFLKLMHQRHYIFFSDAFGFSNDDFGFRRSWRFADA